LLPKKELYALSFRLQATLSIVKNAIFANLQMSMIHTISIYHEKCMVITKRKRESVSKEN